MNELSERYVIRMSFFMNSIVTFPHRSVEFARNIVEDLEDHDDMKRVCKHLLSVLQARRAGSTPNVQHLAHVAKDLQVSHDPYIRVAGTYLEEAITLFDEPIATQQGSNPTAAKP